MRVTLLLLLFPILARTIKEDTDVDDDPPLVDGGVSTSAEGEDIRISRQASFQRGVSSGAEERRIQSISRTEKVNRLQRPTLSRKKQSFLRRRLGHRKSKLSPLKTKVKPMDDTVVEPSANIQVDPATEQQQPTTRGFSRTVPSSSSVTPSPAPTFAPRIHHRRKFMNRGQTRPPTRRPMEETPPTEEAPPTGETTPTEEDTPPPLFTKPPRRIRPTRPSTLRSSFTTRRPVTMLPPSRSSSGFSRRVTEDTEIPDRRVTGTTRSFTMRPPTAPPTSRAEQVSTVSQHTPEQPMSITRGFSHSMRSRLETTVTPSPSPFTRLPPPAPPRQSTPTQLPVMTHPPSPAPLFAPPTFSMPTNPSTLPSTVMSTHTNPSTLSTTFSSAQTSPPTLLSSPMSASTSPHTLSSPPMTQPPLSTASISATPHFSTISTHPAQIPTTMGTLPPVTVTQRPHLTMPPLPTHSTHAPTSLTPPSSTHSLTSATSSSTSSAHSASPPPTSLSTHSSPTTTADLSRNSVTEPAAPAPQRVLMVSANSPGAPGSLPPDDSVVNALNTADDFMDVARRLKLRRNARRKRMAEMQRAWYGRWGTL